MHLSLLLFVLAIWKPEMSILTPGAVGSFDETAVKDPSIVFASGKWHVFYTARGHHQYSLGYVTASRLEDLQKASRFQLVPAYAAAPQVFFYREQQLWYLVYQTASSNYQPVYSTTTTIDEPRSWSPPKQLVVKPPGEKWIDFWIIFDKQQAVLFYTRNHQDVVAMTTSRRAFPSGFHKPVVVYTGVHEAVHVYRDRDRKDYILLFERRKIEDGSRSYGLARSETLLGPWSTVRGWTVDASHGELLRASNDEELEADLEHARFLIQQSPHTENGRDYAELPWSLVLMKND